MRHTCYCKILKRLNELEEELQKNTTSDDNLVQLVREIKEDLEQNTQSDEELRREVEEISETVSGDIDLTPASESQLDDLFND